MNDTALFYRYLATIITHYRTDLSSRALYKKGVGCGLFSMLTLQVIDLLNVLIISPMKIIL